MKDNFVKAIKDTFFKIIELCVIFRKRILIIISISLVTTAILVGSLLWEDYSSAKSNIKYSKIQLQQIALEKIPGEVIKVEKELNFDEEVYEYEFKIKDKGNMLQTVKLDSQSGGILSINNEKSKNENKKSNREE